jgi:hypothetical protein
MSKLTPDKKEKIKEITKIALWTQFKFALKIILAVIAIGFVFIALLFLLTFSFIKNKVEESPLPETKEKIENVVQEISESYENMIQNSIHPSYVDVTDNTSLNLIFERKNSEEETILDTSGYGRSGRLNKTTLAISSTDKDFDGIDVASFIEEFQEDLLLFESRVIGDGEEIHKYIIYIIDENSDISDTPIGYLEFECNPQDVKEFVESEVFKNCRSMNDLFDKAESFFWENGTIISY